MGIADRRNRAGAPQEGIGAIRQHGEGTGMMPVAWHHQASRRNSPQSEPSTEWSVHAAPQEGMVAASGSHLADAPDPACSTPSRKIGHRGTDDDPMAAGGARNARLIVDAVNAYTAKAEGK